VSGLLALVLAFGPFGSERHPVTRDAVAAGAPAESRGSDFFEVAYEVYRGWITPIDGPRCAHRPTCSRYGLLAVRRYGGVGLLLTIDRLMRGEESSSLRRLRFDGAHFLDPLAESTFWFSASH
jgi:hypothetical protein